MAYTILCDYCDYRASGSFDLVAHWMKEHGGLIPDDDSIGRRPEPRGCDGRDVVDGRDGGRRRPRSYYWRRD